MYLEGRMLGIDAYAGIIHLDEGLCSGGEALLNITFETSQEVRAKGPQ